VAVVVVAQEKAKEGVDAMVVAVLGVVAGG